MTPHFKQRIADALVLREQKGLTRHLLPFERGSGGATLMREDRAYLNFSSNDYLGLANDPELIQRWQDGLARLGCGSGASPLVTGFHRVHQNLESQLCEWLGYERAILFNTGFSANQAVIFALLQRDDVLLQDKLNHASLVEAGVFSPATMKRFRHNDVAHLQTLLHPDQANFVVTEGVFSMDGDCSPLLDIDRVTRGKALLMVDDAHGIGVLGNDGAGSCAQQGMRPDLLLVTFGKAFGLSGAALLCDQATGNYLTQFAKHHVYSTAMPPAQAYALSGALHMVQTQHWRRERLQALQCCFEDSFSAFKGVINTGTPIKPIILGSSVRTQQIATLLQEQGFWVGAIRPPTVPEGTARLRITLTANHSEMQIQQLATAFRQGIEGLA